MCDACSNEITSTCSSIERSTKLRAKIALSGNLCFVFRKNAQFCWSLNQQRRLKEEEAPSRRLYGSPAVHHRVYVTSYFHTLRKSTGSHLRACRRARIYFPILHGRLYCTLTADIKSIDVINVSLLTWDEQRGKVSPA